MKRLNPVTGGGGLIARLRSSLSDAILDFAHRGLLRRRLDALVPRLQERWT